MLPFRNFLIGSLLLHVGIILIATIINLYNQNLKKTFIVFGAHSRKHSITHYKALHNHVPFVSNSGKRNSKGNHAHTNGKNKSTKKQSKHSATKKAKSAIKQHPKKSIKRKSKFHELVDEKTNTKKSNDKQRREKEKQAAQKKKEQEQREKERQQKEKKERKKQEEADRKKQEEERKQQEKEKAKQKLEDQKATEKLDVQENGSDESADQTAQNNDDHTDNDQTEDDDNTSTENQDSGFSLMGKYDSNDLHMYHKHVQQEIDHRWRPPVGVPKGTISIGLFKVDNDGTIEKFELIKRSNILIYDLSIIRDARKCQFDKCLWGKQFKVEFRQ